MKKKGSRSVAALIVVILIVLAWLWPSSQDQVEVKGGIEVPFRVAADPTIAPEWKAFVPVARKD
jgi:hypothetical protein